MCIHARICQKRKKKGKKRERENEKEKEKEKEKRTSQQSSFFPSSTLILLPTRTRTHTQPPTSEFTEQPPRRPLTT